jgi:hypothetical protein
MLENLHTKSLPELRQIAKGLGIAVTRESAEVLRTRIILHVNPSLQDELNKNGTIQPSEKPAANAPVWLTPDEVKEALAPFKGRIQLAFYDDEGFACEDNTARSWHVKNGAAEDSGSLTISKKWLVIKVSEIANARFPAKINRTGTDLDGALGV